MNSTKTGFSLRISFIVVLMLSALTVLTTVSCKDIHFRISKKPEMPSESELLATKAVEKSFHCRLTCSKGNEQIDSSSPEEERFFSMRLEDADTIAFVGDWRLQAGACAFLFYEALHDSDRNRFDIIRVAFRNGTDENNTEREFSYLAQGFKIGIECRQKLDMLFACLRNGDVKQLAGLCDTSEFTSEAVTQLWDLGRRLDSVCGPIREFATTGYDRTSVAAVFMGMFRGTKDTCKLMFNIEPGKSKHFVYGVQRFSLLGGK